MSVPVGANGQNFAYPVDQEVGYAAQATGWAEAVTAALNSIGRGDSNNVNAKAVIDMVSTTKGFLVPRMTTTQIAAIASPPEALMLYDTDLRVFKYRRNGVWVSLGSFVEGDLDVNGNLDVSGTGIFGSSLSALSLAITNAITAASAILTGAFQAASAIITGNLNVNGNTTLGNANTDTTTINGTAVSVPNGLNIDSDTLVVDATNNRVGIGNNNPNVPLTITADQSSAQGIAIRGRNSDSISAIDHYAANGTSLLRRNYVDSGGTYYFANSALTPLLTIASTGQLNAVVPSGSTLYPGYLCRAWVNFNGTGSVGSQTIRGSGNVSSVTKTGTGQYTVNIDTDMPDANHARVVAASQLTLIDNSGTSTAGTVFIRTVNSSAVNSDSEFVSVAVFR